MKFVIVPIVWIVFNVIIDSLVFGVVSDNMIMESGLPAKHYAIVIG